jgi:hypothetical protein
MPNSSSVQVPTPQTMFIILIAFVMSCFTFTILIFADILAPAQSPSEGALNPVALVFVGAGFATTMLGLGWGKVIGPKDPIPAGLQSKEFLIRLQTNMIIKAAGFEALAIYGLVVQFLGLGKPAGLVMCGISLLLLLTLIPYLQGNLDYYRTREREVARAEQA